MISSMCRGWKLPGPCLGRASLVRTLGKHGLNWEGNFQDFASSTVCLGFWIRRPSMSGLSHESLRELGNTEAQAIASLK